MTISRRVSYESLLFDSYFIVCSLCKPSLSQHWSSLQFATFQTLVFPLICHIRHSVCSYCNSWDTNVKQSPFCPHSNPWFSQNNMDMESRVMYYTWHVISRVMSRPWCVQVDCHVQAGVYRHRDLIHCGLWGLPLLTTVSVGLVTHVCQVYLQSGSDWPQMGQKRDFLVRYLWGQTCATEHKPD